MTGPIKVDVDNKGIRDELWRGEMKCIDPKVGDADLWIKIGEELQLLTSKEILVEVEHVKAHREADELAKAGQTVQQEREEVHAALQYAASFHCLVATWVLWVRDETGSFEKVSHGGRVLRDISVMVAEREALRMGIERLAALLPTKVSLFYFEIEHSG